MNPSRDFVPVPFGYHQELDLVIDNITNLGLGVGRLDGWVVMVPGVVIGEEVRLRIFRNHRNYSEADLVQVIRPARERVLPRCPLFGQCGGCQYQHMNYETQLSLKTKQVCELFRKLAGVEVVVNPMVPSSRTYNYRSKITPHFERPRNGKCNLGFLKFGSRHSIVDVDACPIATEGINAAIGPMKEAVLAKAKTKNHKNGGTLLLREVAGQITSDNNEIVMERVGLHRFYFKAGEFFQNNPYILPEFVEFILTKAAGNGAEVLLDVYCGVGLFGICGSSRFEKVIGIEINEDAIKLARRNAEENRVTNVDFVVGDAEKIFETVGFSGKTSSVILDPPRSGCSRGFINQLIAFRPGNIVYVSCAPDSQARDIHLLLQEGYAITEVQPFDLFPQTRHIENVVLLRLV
ncbi:MAG: class I SAM-dependent RNA methyltransferase [Puniceicoccales bacterium]|jgi:23S rRNA (uracil1939-C5)-methyltransferase/tRNA (uracil-5-)-methyltransferase|nr:class I SAM-dependent RNA methyltransferase [Puniceicoccales bacterium]